MTVAALSINIITLYIIFFLTYYTAGNNIKQAPKGLLKLDATDFSIDRADRIGMGMECP